MERDGGAFDIDLGILLVLCTVIWISSNGTPVSVEDTRKYTQMLSTPGIIANIKTVKVCLWIRVTELSHFLILVFISPQRGLKVKNTNALH